MARPFEDAVAAYDRGDYARAARLWCPLADQGDGRAQSNLGVMYAKGWGVRQDYAAAANWYRKAAEQGNANAQCNLGLLYAEGRGVPQDHRAAASWYRKAAEQGNGRAQYNLGIMYAQGQGVPQDYSAAASWYGKAADQGVKGAEMKAQQARKHSQEREQEQREQEQGRRRNEEQQETRRQRTNEHAAASDGARTQDWWMILGTLEDATMETAKQAYRSKMKQYHPDRVVGLGPELVQLAEQKTRELNAAIEQAERHRSHEFQCSSGASQLTPTGFL
jgi:TPR repeat protein